MYILSGNEKEIIDSNFVERFVIVERDDAVLIVASYSGDRKVTVSKYKNAKEAKDVLNDMFSAFDRGQYCYEMPVSSLFSGNAGGIKDARVKRKGRS